MEGWVKLWRSGYESIASDKNALALLMQIAIRARRTGDEPNPHNLEIGQALIGDCKSIGLTRGEYRTAQRHLKQAGHATFKATTYVTSRNGRSSTSRGTIATLLNNSVFDINVTGQQPVENPLGQPHEQPVRRSNKNIKKKGAKNWPPKTEYDWQ